MFSGDLEHMRVVKQERHAKFAQDHGMTRLAMREGHGFIGYSKGRNVERALGFSLTGTVSTSPNLAKA